MLAYIIEDSLDITEVERFALERNDFEVESFVNGKDFFKAVSNRKPDLILLDVLIGEENGLDIVEKLRAQAEYRYIPIMLASSCDAETDKARGLDAGADDVEVSEEVVEVYCEPTAVAEVSGALEAAGYTVVSAEAEMVPQTYTKLENEDDIKNMQKLLDMLEDNDDVQNVYHNWEEEE